MGLENLFQGLQMFQQGLQQYTTSKAIGQATEAVNQLNQSELTDQQKRVEQMRLGNQLALHLGQLGAPVSQIQSATGAIKPEQFGSPEEMMMRGMLEGRQDLTKQGQEISTMINKPKIEAEDRAYKRQIALQDRKFNQELQLEMMKAGAKGKGMSNISGFEQVDPNIKLSEAEIKDFRSANAATAQVAQSAQRLEKLVEDSGTEWFPSLSEGGLKMQTEYENLLFKLKEFNKLGVLQKIDIDRLQALIPDPTSFGSRTGNWKDRMAQFKTQLNDDLKEAAASKGFKPKAEFLQRIGLEKAAPIGSGLQPGQIIVPGVDPKTGQEGRYIYDTVNKRNLGPWTGAD